MTDSERYRSGDRIAGKYLLVRKLDQGGMGTVWAARDTELDVHVALKLLRPELADTNAAERLLAEARMLARVQHPAVVRVHDRGRTDQGDPFVVMELLDGECLADVMDRRGRIPAVEAVSLLLPVIDGVRAAHDAGIVHRDIKPENIFLARVGGRMQPKLLDFGIALSDTIDVRRTTHGAVVGSPVYMSPEQARGEAVTAATDLWALTVVLFELVSASLPFSADNYNAVLCSIIADESPSLADRGVGDELLAAIVERGLCKNAARRFASAKELGTALAEWLLGQGVSEDAAHVSLRAGWLARRSEPPASLRPMVVGPSDRPPADDRTTLPAPGGAQVTASSDTSRSVEGLSLTSSQKGRHQRRRLWVASAAGAALAFGTAVVWLRSADGAGATGSAAPQVSVAPTSDTSSAATEPPAPVEVVDAGAAQKPAVVEPAPSRTTRPQARPAKPQRTYRPRGI